MSLHIGGDGNPGFSGLATRSAPYSVDMPANKAQDLRNVINRNGKLEKRPGFTRIGTSAIAAAVGLGIYEYDLKSGTFKRLVKAGSTFAEVNGTFDGFTNLETGTTNSTRPFKAVTLRDLALIADYDQFFVYDATNSVFGFATHAAPSAPTVIAGAGSLPNGTYQYITVPYSSYLAQEGPISAITSYTVTGTTAPNVTPTYSADDIWDQVRVYRTVVGGSTFLFHSTISTPFAAFNDTTADASLGAAISSTTRVQIADASDVVSRNDRTFLIRKNDFLVYYSESGKPNEFLAASTIDALNKQEKPVALAQTQSHIYVLGERAVWLLAGDRASNYSIAKIEDTSGCRSRPSVQVFEDVIYYLGEGAIYAFDGFSLPVDISTPDIMDKIRSISISRLDQIASGISKRNREYWIAYTESGASLNATLLRYRIDTKEWFHDDVYASALGELRNSNGEFRMFHQDDLGYLYEDEAAHYRSGLSTANAGTATGGSTTTLTDSGAAFPTTGGGLVGLFVEITRASGTRTTNRITANTSTELTFAATTAVASGDTYVVCPNRAWWTSRRHGSGTNSRWGHAEVHFEEQSHSTSLILAFRVDSETSFVEHSISMSSAVYGDSYVGRYGRRCVTKIELGGDNVNMEIVELLVESEDLES